MVVSQRKLLMSRSSLMRSLVRTVASRSASRSAGTGQPDASAALLPPAAQRPLEGAHLRAHAPGSRFQPFMNSRSYTFAALSGPNPRAAPSRRSPASALRAATTAFPRCAAAFRITCRYLLYSDSGVGWCARMAWTASGPKPAWGAQPGVHCCEKQQIWAHSGCFSLAGRLLWRPHGCPVQNAQVCQVTVG